MKVGFFLQGNNQDYVRMAKLTIASVRKAMPGVEIVHLTDADTPMVEGADSVKRICETMPMAVRRMKHNSQLEGEWLLIDCDVIVQKDVRHVFEEPFDVALTDRIGTITYESKYAEVMPYNLGVAFSCSPAFWKLVLRHLGTLSPKYQQWEGDQLVVCEMIKQRAASDFKVKILPGAIYNFPPKFAGDGKDAAICHYKGPRKAFLKEAA